MADLNEVASLLHIYEKCLDHPQLQNLKKVVWDQLVDIDAQHAPPKPEVEPEPEPVELTPLEGEEADQREIVRKV